MPAHESPKQFPDPPPRTPQDVRAWLESAVAQVTGLDPDTVDPDRPLAELGLGSRQLVTLAADLSASTRSQWKSFSSSPSSTRGQSRYTSMSHV